MGCPAAADPAEAAEAFVEKEVFMVEEKKGNKGFGKKAKDANAMQKDNEYS